jgi:hypothetical protein
LILRRGREEGEEEMTDAFIAKVLSVIYNYAIDEECLSGEELKKENK